jgi:hypothetical protein
MRAEVRARVAAATLVALLAIPFVPASVALAGDPTNTAVASSLNPSAYGDSVTFRATVTGTGTPTGSVQFTVDGNDLGAPAALVDGSATSDPISDLSATNHVVTAAYTSDDPGSFADSTGILPGGQDVTKASQTISFGTLADKTFGDSPFPVSATSESGLAVTFNSQTGGICTVAGTSVTIVAAGDCTIRASQGGDANWDPAPTVDRTFTVAKAGQTITFDPLGSKTYGDPTFGVSATSDSGLTVAFSSTTTGVCTVAGTTVTIGAAGTCTIRASQAGNGNYAPATPINRSFTVATLPITVTAATDSKVYDGTTASAGTPTITSGDLVNGDTATWTQTFATPTAGTGKTITPAGSVNDGNGGLSYDVAFVAVHDGEITKATPAITWSDPASITYGTALSATQLDATANVPGAFAYVPASGTVLSGGAGQALKADFTPSDTTDYNPASLTVHITVNPAGQAIVFPQPPGVTFGDTPFAVSATATSGLTVAFSSTTTGVCTVAGTMVTIVTAGSCTIRASQSGNANYAAATAVDRTVAVAQAGQAITFPQPPDATYGDAPFGISATSDSGLAVAFTSLTTTVCTVAGTTVTIAGAGSCTIRASQAGDGDYLAATPVTRTLQVAKAVLTVTANNKTRAYGLANPAFDVGIAGFVYGQTLGTSGVTGTPTCSTTAGVASPVSGSPYAITCVSGTLTAAHYSFTFVAGDLTLTRAASGTTVSPDDSTPVYGQSVLLTATVTPQAGGSATGTVTFKDGLVTMGTGTLSSGHATLTTSALGGGPHSITAVYGGDGNLVGSTSAATIVTVSKAALTVTANGALRAYGASDPTFDATITGFVNGETLGTSDVGGSPGCTSTATATSTVAGGPYLITCGNGTLASANYTFSFVEGLLAVTRADLTVTADAASRQYRTADPSLTATVSGFANGEDPTSAGVTGAADCTSDSTLTDPAGTAATITCTVGSLDAPNYEFTTFTDGTLTITPALPVPTVAADINPVPASAPITLTATVAWPGETPTGTITFFEGAADLSGAVAVDGSGHASFTTIALSAGTHPITATYSGDGGNFGEATSTAFNVVVGKSAVQVDLTTVPTTWETKVPIAFTATLTPVASGVTIPVTGSVAFEIDGAPKATVAVTGGKATYSSPALALGSRTVVATYTPDLAADAAYNAGDFDSLTQTVIANTVAVSGVGLSATGFYPYPDTYRDTVSIRGTRGEPLSVVIKIYDPKRHLVRSATLGRAAGAYAWAWNGRNTSRSLVPAGKYKVVQTLADAYGASKAYTSYVTVSSKRMTWKTVTMYVLKGPRCYQFKVADGSVSSFTCSSTGALTISGKAGHWPGIGYQLGLPSATTYKNLKVQILGSWSGTKPVLGLHDWTHGSSWGQLFQAWYVRTAVSPTSKVYATLRVATPTHFITSRKLRVYLDAGRVVTSFKLVLTKVRVTFTYGILK